MRKCVYHKVKIVRSGGWAEHVARMRETGTAYRILVERNISQNSNLKDFQGGRKITLRWVLG